ncbi:MAG: PadR family transcriptional regulator [Chloroflexota bacterium]
MFEFEGRRGRHRAWGGFWGAGMGGRHQGGGGGPWGFRRRFFEPGEVRIALLSLLKDGPKHGYELMKELESRSGGMYKASAGTVYPNLQLLEDEGLIRAEVRDEGKRVYTITDAGRAELEKNKDAAERVWSRASAWDDWSDSMTPAAMEVMGPAMRVMRASFQAAAKGDSQRVEEVRAVLNRAVAEIEKLGKTADQPS